jgi:tetratricopeptide (TPR) repeat protein
MLLCASCGHQVPEVACFCPMCGEPTGAEPIDLSRVFTQPRQGVLCPGCSQRTQPEGDYCMWCGFRLDSLGEGTDPRVGHVSEAITAVGAPPLGTTVNQAVRPPGGGGRPLLVAIIAGLVVALGVVGVMLVAALKRAESLAAVVSQGVSSASESSPAALRYAEALDHLEQGRHEEAEVMLRAALLAEPRHVEARRKLEEVRERAQVSLNAGRARDDLLGRDFEGALQAVNRIPIERLEADPELVALRARVRAAYLEHHLGQSSLAEKGGDLQSAEAHLLTVLALEADHVLARARLEELRTRLTRSQRRAGPARPAASELAELSPDLNAEQLVRRASEASQRGNYLLAIESLQRAIKLKPEDTDLLRLLGNAYALEGRRGEALRQYRRYLEVCPNCVYTQTVRAAVRAFEEMGVR